MIFGADLMRAVEIDSEYVCIRTKSYGKKMQSSGKIEVTGAESLFEIKNRHVILVEDIVDTGNTLFYLKDYLKQYEPLSVEIATLFSKPDMRKVDLEVKYCGYDIAPLFIVGFGLDYAHKGRNLKDVYILDE